MCINKERMLEMENLRQMMGVVIISTEEYSLLCETKARLEAVKRVVEANNKETFVYVRDMAAALDIDVSSTPACPEEQPKEEK
jgi:hypothetical protein